MPIPATPDLPFQPGVTGRYQCILGTDTWSKHSGTIYEANRQHYVEAAWNSPTYWSPVGWLEHSGTWYTEGNFLCTGNNNAVVECLRQADYPFFYSWVDTSNIPYGMSLRVIGDMQDQNNYKFAELLVHQDYTNPYRRSLLRLGRCSDGQDSFLASFRAGQVFIPSLGGNIRDDNQGFGNTTNFSGVGLCIKENAFYAWNQRCVIGAEGSSDSLRHGLATGPGGSSGIVQFGNYHLCREHDHPHVPAVSGEYEGKPKCGWFDPPPGSDLTGVGASFLTKPETKYGSLAAYMRGGVLGNSLMVWSDPVARIAYISGLDFSRFINDNQDTMTYIALWVSLEAYPLPADPQWTLYDICAYGRRTSDNKLCFMKGVWNSNPNLGINSTTCYEITPVAEGMQWGTAEVLGVKPTHEWIQ